MTDSPTWPNFFIVGVGKAGTTSLYAWLQQHPEIYLPTRKEPNFFSRDLVKHTHHVTQDLDEYLNLFTAAKDFKAIGEASVSYFSHWEHVPQRIKDAVPNARIIILLRNPVERAYSSYLMYVRNGRETRSFSDAIRHSPLAENYKRKYSQPVRAFLDIFGRDQVLILLFDDLKKTPRNLLERVATFLGVDSEPIERINLTVEGQGGTPRWKWAPHIWSLRKKISAILPLPNPIKRVLRTVLISKQTKTIDPRDIKYLQTYFQSDIDELEQLLGKPLPELR